MAVHCCCCSKKTVALTLWGAAAEEAGGNLEALEGTNPVLSVSSCRVTDYNGALALTNFKLHVLCAANALLTSPDVASQRTMVCLPLQVDFMLFMLSVPLQLHASQALDVCLILLCQ